MISHGNLLQQKHPHFFFFLFFLHQIEGKMRKFNIKRKSSRKSRKSVNANFFTLSQHNPLTCATNWKNLYSYFSPPSRLARFFLRDFPWEVWWGGGKYLDRGSFPATKNTYIWCPVGKGMGWWENLGRTSNQMIPGNFFLCWAAFFLHLMYESLSMRSNLFSQGFISINI